MSLSLPLTLLLLMSLLWLPVALVSAQDSRAAGEEFDITLTVQQQGSTLIPSVLAEDDVYLPVFGMFRFLRIQCLSSVTGDTLTGFFLSEDTPYEIDFTRQRIRLGQKEFTIERTDFIRTEMSVFLRRSLFGEIFGLQCSFDFRALRVELTSDLRIPLIKEMERERIRKNAARISGSRIAERTIPRGMPLLRPGALDWKLAFFSQSGARSTMAADIAAGIGLLGGDADIALAFNNQQLWTPRDIKAQWRYVDNSSPLLRQLSLLRGAAVTAGGRQQSMTGVMLSNRPTGIRSSFGTYVVDGQTGAEWTVELYMNQVIIDVATADASGYYRFELPLTYGATTLTLRFFGPWGEERTQERVIDIPFTFLPGGEIEYTFTAGRLEDEENTWAGALRLNMGAGRFLTIGGGADYLLREGVGSFAPLLSASLRPTDGTLLNAEYLHDNRISVIASASLPGRVTLVGSYTRNGRLASALSAPGSELRTLSVAAPVSGSFVQANARLQLRQEVSGGAYRYAVESILSGTVLGVRGNLSITGDHLSESTRMLMAAMSVSIRTPMQGTLRPQISGDLLSAALQTIGAGYEQPLGAGSWLTASVQQNLRSSVFNAQIGVRYELPFAQTAAAVSVSDGHASYAQSAGGSIGFDAENVRAIPDPRSWLRRGGLTVEAFLDINDNGVRDAGEERLHGLDVKVDGGRLITGEADTLLRVVDLEAYRSYYLEVSAVNFENISWQLHKKSIQVEALPNQFVSVSVPVVVAGEVSGKIVPDSTLIGKRTAGLRLRFQRPDGSTAASVLTEKDGSFYFLGLAPGRYVVEIDPEQLERLQYRAGSEEVVIRGSREGDIIEDVVLRLGQI